MRGTCLVTGGAGFIGCALSPSLADEFDHVVVLDNLHPQVHAEASRPAALDRRVDLVEGDVTDERVWDRLLAEVRPSTVIHLAAETGTAQSLTEASRHASVNVLGTTRMLDAFTRTAALPERILLTSSRAIYGEGSWQDAAGEVCYPGQRSHRMLRSGTYDFPGLQPLPAVAADVRPDPTSVYGATKLAQENIIRAWALSVDVTPVLLRLQNVYGPGQSLTNPYTGIVSLFAQLARAGSAIPVYEDGQITRDFVYIDDVVEAIRLGATAGSPGSTPYDIGQGRATTVSELAQTIAQHYGAPAPVVTGQFRDGDVRHASCRTEAAAADLGWRPSVSLEEGITRLCTWIDGRAA